MFTRKKRFFYKGGSLVALAALLLTLTSCGATSSAPTVNIPAPVVTKISISTPDNGVSTITGEAGAVVGGNTVRAINLTQEGIATVWWEKLLWGVAYAQTTNETTANADGSFTLQIDAATGDRIRILQIDPFNGDQSPPIELTVPFQPLPLSFAPVDLAVDPTSSEAWMTGQFSGNGIINPINFGANPSTGAGINLPAGCNDPTALAIDGANARAIVVDNSTGGVCSQPLDGSAGALLAFLTVNPVNIAIHSGAAKAAITNNTAAAAVEVSILDLNLDAFAPVPLPNPAGGANQVSTPVVMTATNGATNYAVVVVEYSNGEFYGFVVDVDGPAVIGSGSLLSITSAQDIAGFNNTQGVLVDGAGVAHILNIDTATGSVTISNTVDVGSSPTGVAIDEANNRAFVTNTGEDTLSVLDLSFGSETVTNTLSLGNGPTAIGFELSGQNQLGVIHSGEQTAIVLSSAL